MAITSDDETRQTNDAVVSVRIPNGADGDLATEAERRLSRTDGVTDVTVEGLRGLEPGLSATVATVVVSVATTGDVRRPAVADALTESVDVEGIVERPD